MLAAVVEGENIENASEGSRSLFTSSRNLLKQAEESLAKKKPTPASTANYKLKMLRAPQLDVTVCLSFALFL